MTVKKPGTYDGMKGLVRHGSEVDINFLEDLADEDDAIDEAVGATLVEMWSSSCDSALTADVRDR
jgi:hypothetical protein